MSRLLRLPTLDHLPADATDGQAVFVRVDFNVPMDGDRVVDTTRIDAALPTLRRLFDQGSRLVLGSHRGRPKGRPDPAASLALIAPVLAERLGLPVRFCHDCIGPTAQSAVAALGRGEILLLENLRFYSGEEANDPAFVAQLAQLASVYVNDAFGTAHRSHASTVGLAEAIPLRAAGLLLQKELQVFNDLLHAPARPFLAILGGAKISGKLETMQHLVGRVDRLAVGGGMANTLLAAQGAEMGSSLVETDRIPVAKDILEACKQQAVELVLPADIVTTTSLEGPQPHPRTIRSCASERLHSDEIAVDIGPATAVRIAEAVHGAATVFWNGPMGVFETKPYELGSVAVAKAVGSCPGFSVIGGGETVAAVKAAGAEGGINHVSTGGGAALQLLAGKPLPAVEALIQPAPGELT